jgi:hypothetical protein
VKTCSVFHSMVSQMDDWNVIAMQYGMLVTWSTAGVSSSERVHDSVIRYQVMNAHGHVQECLGVYA